MAKKKAKVEAEAKEVVVLLDLKEVLKTVDRSKPFTFNRGDFDKTTLSVRLVGAGTSKIEYHANGEITLHWK
jgi:hypothetical protein